MEKISPWGHDLVQGLTLLFEVISRLAGKHDTRIWRVLEHYVEASRGKEDFSSVSMVGVDETSRAKGHTYVTLLRHIGTE